MVQSYSALQSMARSLLCCAGLVVLLLPFSLTLPAGTEYGKQLADDIPGQWLPWPVEEFVNEQPQKRLEDYFDQIETDIVRKLRKKAADDKDRVMVFFDCPSGRAVCNHGGVGPAITYRRHHGPICTCLCPQEYNSPRCDFPTDSITEVDVNDLGNDIENSDNKAEVFTL